MSLEFLTFDLFVLITTFLVANDVMQLRLTCKSFQDTIDAHSLYINQLTLCKCYEAFTIYCHRNQFVLAKTIFEKRMVDTTSYLRNDTILRMLANACKNGYFGICKLLNEKFILDESDLTSVFESLYEYGNIIAIEWFIKYFNTFRVNQSMTKRCLRYCAHFNNNSSVIQLLINHFNISSLACYRTEIEDILCKKGKICDAKWIINRFNINKSDIIDSSVLWCLIQENQLLLFKWIVARFDITREDIINKDVAGRDLVLTDYKFRVKYNIQSMLNVVLKSENNFVFASWFVKMFAVTTQDICKPYMLEFTYKVSELEWLIKHFAISKSDILTSGVLFRFSDKQDRKKISDHYFFSKQEIDKYKRRPGEEN